MRKNSIGNSVVTNHTNGDGNGNLRAAGKEGRVFDDKDEDLEMEMKYQHQQYQHPPPMENGIPVDVHKDPDEMSSLGDGQDSHSSDSEMICAGDIATGVHNDAILDKALRRQARSKRNNSCGNMTENLTVSSPSAGGIPDGLPLEVVVDTSSTENTKNRRSDRRNVNNMETSGRAMSDVSSLGRSQVKRESRKSTSSTHKRASRALMLLQNMSDDGASEDEHKYSHESENDLLREANRAQSHKPKRNVKIPEKHTASKISFGHIHVRTYERILGDNPCSNGPPLSIGWRFNHKRAVSVDDFERVRLVTRKDSQDLILPRERREAMLMDIGYSRAELAESIRANIKIKSQRRQTVHNLPVAKLEEVAEKMKRKVKGVFTPKWKDRER